MSISRTMSKHCPDLTGQVFHWLTVLSRQPRTDSRVHWYCRCQCGAIATVRTDSLMKAHGPTKSCGCWTASQCGLRFQNKKWSEARREASDKSKAFFEANPAPKRSVPRPTVFAPSVPPPVAKPPPGEGPEKTLLRTILGARQSCTRWSDIAEMTGVSIEEVKNIYNKYHDDN